MSSPPSPVTPIRYGSGSGGRNSVGGSTYVPSTFDSPRIGGPSSSSPPSMGSGSIAQTPVGPLLERFRGDIDREKSNIDAVEEGHPESGWLLLVGAMMEVPEFRSFSRFEKLTLKTLMYYQVEIAYLENELQLIEKRDYDKYKGKTIQGDSMNIHFTSWPEKLVPNTTRELKSLRSPPSDDKIKSDGYLQWQIILRIRRTLEAYNNALIQYAQVSKLPSPPKQCIEILNDKLEALGGDRAIEGMGKDAWILKRESSAVKPTWRFIWSFLWTNFGFGQKPEPFVPSLVSLLPADNCDELSMWMKTDWMPFKRELKKRLGIKERTAAVEDSNHNTLLDGVGRVPGEKFLRITAAIATILTSALPVGGIVILYFVKPTLVRLGIIAAFAVLVSSALLVVAKCKRIDVFMATAAFSAVLVVFVSG